MISMARAAFMGIHFKRPGRGSIPIEHGADVNAQGGEYCNALSASEAASYLGTRNNSPLSGRNMGLMSMPVWRHHTANVLSAAKANGNNSIVRFLLP
jgi:hypothetical protein